MLKTGQLRIKILLLATMIFLVALSGCVQKKDIYAILLEQYEALDTNHYENGMNLIISQNLQKKAGNDTTFALVFNRIDEVDSQLDLFVLDKKLNITHHTTAEFLIGPCYSVNSFIFENKRVIFGELSNVMDDKNSDEDVSVNLTNIELKFSDGLTINQGINTSNQGYLILADTTAEISEANVYEHEKIISSLADVPNNVCELQTYTP